MLSYFAVDDQRGGKRLPAAENHPLQPKDTPTASQSHAHCSQKTRRVQSKATIYSNGWSIYQHLRAQPPYDTLPFILLTAAPPTNLPADDPFLCLVAKPFDPPALFMCMCSLLQLVDSSA